MCNFLVIIRILHADHFPNLVFTQINEWICWKFWCVQVLAWGTYFRWWRRHGKLWSSFSYFITFTTLFAIIGCFATSMQTAKRKELLEPEQYVNFGGQKCSKKCVYGCPNGKKKEKAFSSVGLVVYCGGDDKTCVCVWKLCQGLSIWNKMWRLTRSHFEENCLFLLLFATSFFYL